MTAPDLDALAALLDKATATGEHASGYELGIADEATREILARMPALLAYVRKLGRKCEPRRDLGGSTHWDIAEAGAICHPECAITQLRDARRTAALAMRERCAQLLNITRSDAQLMAGDMTAGEWRTVSAVLRNRAAAIRALEG